jgi:D-alanine-D-alanine ligase
VRVLLVYGGPSAEHAVSRASAAGVRAALGAAGYDVLEAEVGEDGRWRSGAEHLSPFGAAPDVDVVFPLIHGPFGEDGALQGLLEWCRVPYVGSGVYGSAVAMDKAVMKAVLSAAGLPSVRFELVERLDLQDGREVLDRCEALGPYPRFVKPARLGSSVGIGRALDDSALLAALAAAARYDDRLLVEEGVSGRELECGIVSGASGLMTSVVGEIRHTRSFYDYTAKYDPASGTRLVVPAPLDEGATAQVHALAAAAFRALQARDLARVDFFLADDGRLLVNELNTLPGFTPSSMFPLLWQASGVGAADLARTLVESALRRGARLGPEGAGRGSA